MGTDSSNRKRQNRRRWRRPRLRIVALFFAGILLLLATSRSYGQQATDERDVRAVLDDQVAAWNRGDVVGYMKGYWHSDSTEFVSGATLTRGYGKVLSHYHKSYDTPDKMGKLEFRSLDVRLLSADVAMASGIWELRRKSDKPWGRFTLILEKKPEGWRIIHDHTSSAQ